MESLKGVAPVGGIQGNQEFLDTHVVIPRADLTRLREEVERLKESQRGYIEKKYELLAEAETAWPVLNAANAFCRHFFKCFFCHIGDRYIEDHFCETGRELIVAMLDEMDGRP
jgi:hypothetical protein